MNRNIKLIIAYDGTDFCGWQRQSDCKQSDCKQSEHLQSEHLQAKRSDSAKSVRTVQGEIEAALFKMHGKPVTLFGAGRTDAGVHAAAQAANFQTDIDGISPDRFKHALNSLLSHDVRITESSEAGSDFHARFSAKSRLYRYQFICRSSGSFLLPHESRYNLKLYRFPNISLLNAYGRLLLGETDCSIFAAGGDTAVTEEKSKNRYIYSSHFYMENKCLIFEIRANAFLRNMVRSVAGTFLHYEEKNTPPEKLREIISSKKRSLAGPTLPPQGLFLWHVEY